MVESTSLGLLVAAGAVGFGAIRRWLSKASKKEDWRQAVGRQLWEACRDCTKPNGTGTCRDGIVIGEVLKLSTDRKWIRLQVGNEKMGMRLGTKLPQPQLEERIAVYVKDRQVLLWRYVNEKFYE